MDECVICVEAGEFGSGGVYKLGIYVIGIICMDSFFLNSLLFFTWSVVVLLQRE